MLELQKYLRGTNTCMKRLDMATKGCGQIKSNDTYFADSWFSSVKMAKGAMAAGVDYCMLTETGHKGFCIATVEICLVT